MAFEHKSEPRASKSVYFHRLAAYAGITFTIIFASLLIGILGYHNFERLPWIDALLNASMILGGMGPVNPLSTPAGKIFASCYALFSGVIFLFSVGILLAPILHRLLHRFHMDLNKGD